MLGFSFGSSPHHQPWIRLPEGRIGAACHSQSRFQKSLAAIQPRQVFALHFFEVAVAPFGDEMRLHHHSHFVPLKLCHEFRRRNAGMFYSVALQAANIVQHCDKQSKRGAGYRMHRHRTPSLVSSSHLVCHLRESGQRMVGKDDFVRAERDIRHRHLS